MNKPPHTLNKFLVTSSLHDNKELVVLGILRSAIVDIRRKPSGNSDVMTYDVEGFERAQSILDEDVLSANTAPIVFSQKEALERIKQERDKLELGLISQEEYEKRKADWAKYIK